MDANRFDRWTRSIGAHASRRSLVRLLVATGAALLPGNRLLRAEPAAAQCTGYYCPCTTLFDCADGLICCGSTCQTPGMCGLDCVLLGDPCPSFCSPGSSCTACCGGICSSGGTCDNVSQGYPGDHCRFDNPVACVPPLFCCRVAGGTDEEGACLDECHKGVHPPGES